MRPAVPLGGGRSPFSFGAIMPSRPKTLGWTLVAVALAAVVTGALAPRKVIRDTPMMRAMNRLRQISGNLPYYAGERDNALVGHAGFESIEALVTGGVVTPDDAAFLRTNGYVFYGFDPNMIRAEIPVFETVLTNTRPPRRLIGYSDGHVVASELGKKP